jgi:hypothetical protein
MNTLAYKPNFQAVVERHKRFWNRNMPHQILVKMDIDTMHTMDAVARALSRCPDREEMLSAWIDHYEDRKDLEDDSFPVSRVSYGSFAYGMYFGANMRWMESGGWASPVLDTWDALERIFFDTNRFWIREHLETVRYFASQGKNRFAVAPTATIDALNLAEAHRGTAAY